MSNERLQNVLDNLDEVLEQRGLAIYQGREPKPGAVLDLVWADTKALFPPTVGVTLPRFGNFGDADKLRFGMVSWSTWGSVDPLYASNYADLISNAAEVVTFLNSVASLIENETDG